MSWRDRNLVAVIKGDNAFVRYSANADGTDFTEMWTSGQNYIGVMTGATASANKADYTWSLFKGEKGDMGGTAPVVQTTGQSTESVMSQKSITDQLNKINQAIINAPFGDYAFYWNTAMTSINITTNVTRIGTRAFGHCTNLTNIVIPNSVRSFGNAIFSSSGLQSITLGNGSTTLSDYMFEICQSLTSITIPDNVVTINQGLCFGCGQLATVTIGNAVTSIGQRAFYGCASLTSFTCNTVVPPTIQTETFGNLPANCVIYVPAASVDAYKAATNWSARAAYIQAIV